MSQRELYGASYRVKEKITTADLLARTRPRRSARSRRWCASQLMRNQVDLIEGTARFLDAHTVLVEDQTRGERTHASAASTSSIATGTKPARPARRRVRRRPGARLRRASST